MENYSGEKCSLKQPIVKEPMYSPGKPPKKYNRKKTIGIFGCLNYSYGLSCPEIISATIGSGGDIYIIPLIGYGIGDFHLSYHKSGKFHWVLNEKHIQPVQGEEDFAQAFNMWLKIKKPSCFCFRRGRRLAETEIIQIVERLSQHFPIEFDVQQAAHNIIFVGFFILTKGNIKRIALNLPVFPLTSTTGGE